MMLLDAICLILRNSTRAVLRPRTKCIDGELVQSPGRRGDPGRRLGAVGHRQRLQREHSQAGA